MREELELSTAKKGGENRIERRSRGRSGRTRSRRNLYHVCTTKKGKI